MFNLTGKKAIITGATGKVLSGLSKRIVPDIATTDVGVPADLEIFAKVE